MDQSRDGSVSGPPPVLSPLVEIEGGETPLAETQEEAQEQRRESNATATTRNTARTSMSVEGKSGLERKA